MPFLFSTNTYFGFRCIGIADSNGKNSGWNSSFLLINKCHPIAFSYFHTASHSFPYVKKRIQVVSQTSTELNPIEVAIDEMSKKVQELQQLCTMDDVDMIRLQLKLQGSVSVKVRSPEICSLEKWWLWGQSECQVKLCAANVWQDTLAQENRFLTSKSLFMHINVSTSVTSSPRAHAV